MRYSGAGLALALVALVGCGGGPKTYPINGKLVFDRGDVKLLAGNSVYCRHEQDPNIAARGDIKDDGTFQLETHAAGQILSGAPEGTYRAWIALDDSQGSPESQFRKLKIDPKFLDGEATTWTFKVPTDGEVVLTATPAKPGARMISPE